jgi:rare lipoprotein A
MSIKKILIPFFATILFSGCSTSFFQKNSYKNVTINNNIKTKKYKKLPKISEIGIASYYGYKWHGRTTANGEKLNIYAMTAAHKSLPFNTIVKVTDLDTGKFVIVRINDRGPYVSGRVIDLTDAAAKKLGILHKGIARVKVETI